MNEFRIKIEIVAPSKDEAVKMFNEHVDSARQASFEPTAHGGCAVKGPLTMYIVKIGDRPPSDRERIHRIERVLGGADHVALMSRAVDALKGAK